MKYRIVYDSRTGNTQRVAGAIEKGLAAYTGAVCRIEEALEQGPDPETDVYFVGFWNDKGTCSEGVQSFLSRLHGTRAALFGTCGMGSSEAYFRQVEDRVRALLPEDCGYLGAFLCAGRMPAQVLERYRRELAYGIVSLCNILFPEVICLGGGVSAADESLLLNPLRELVHGGCFNQDALPELTRASLGNDAGIVGAAMLCRM